MDSSTSMSTQPAPIPLPSTTTSILPIPTAEASRTSTATYPPVKFQFRRTRRVITALSDILVLVWIGLLVVPVAIGVVIGSIAMTALSFASLASVGAIAMLTGNGILRAAHLTHYTSNASAAYIGAVGSLISFLILALFTPCIPKTYDEEGNETTPWYIQLCMYLLLCTLSGTIGAAILLHRHVDLGGIDVLHATRAAALGGAILGLGSIFIAPLAIGLAITFIFSPLWLAICMGAQWVYVRSSEEWTGRSYSYSYCYCYGTRGDDPEINSEIARLPRH